MFMNSFVYSINDLMQMNMTDHMGYNDWLSIKYSSMYILMELTCHSNSMMPWENPRRTLGMFLARSRTLFLHEHSATSIFQENDVKILLTVVNVFAFLSLDSLCCLVLRNTIKQSPREAGQREGNGWQDESPLSCITE